jgi:hypothetical protein
MQPPPLALQCMRKRPDRRNNRTDGILLVRLFRTANLSNWATYMRAYSAGTGTVASSGTVVVVCVRPACWGGATYDYYGSHKRGPFVRARTASAMHHGRLVRWSWLGIISPSLRGMPHRPWRTARHRTALIRALLIWWTNTRGRSGTGLASLLFVWALGGPRLASRAAHSLKFIQAHEHARGLNYLEKSPFIIPELSLKVGFTPSSGKSGILRDGFGSDRISDVTIYDILFWIRIRIRIQNGYFEFGFAFEYLLVL